MSGSTFGRIFRLTTFGESHGPALGGIIDGCPAGLEISEEIVQKELDARRPGRDGVGGLAATARREPDAIRILSGVFEGKTTGTPIGFCIENTNQRSGDYAKFAHIFRPGHADISWHMKYDGHRDYRGGGRASARETVARVAGGAVAQQFLAKHGMSFSAFTVELGGIAARPPFTAIGQTLPFFAPNETVLPQWEESVRAARAAGDTLGGIVQVEAHGVPSGLGEPVFDKLDAMIAGAFMSVGAVKGVEIGAGFEAARMTGSRNNDSITPGGFASNNAGGILGGVSTGAPIVVRAAVKPIPSIALPQDTIDENGEACVISIGGRHDCSAIPRIVPVLKAMLALVLADAFLMQKRMD